MQLAGSCRPLQPTPLPLFFKPSMLAIGEKHHVITVFALGEGWSVQPHNLFLCKFIHACSKEKGIMSSSCLQSGKAVWMTLFASGKTPAMSTLFTVHEDRRVQQRRQATTVTKIASPTPAVIVTVDTFSNSMTITRTRPRPPRSL